MKKQSFRKNHYSACGQQTSVNQQTDTGVEYTQK